MQYIEIVSPITYQVEKQQAFCNLQQKYLCKINLFKGSHLQIKYLLQYNQAPIIIQCKSHLQLMCRYINKLNSQLRGIQFQIDMRSGLIYVVSQLIKCNKNWLQENLQYLIDAQIRKLLQIREYHLKMILYRLGLIESKQLNVMTEKQKIQKQQLVIKYLQRIIEISHIGFSRKPLITLQLQSKKQYLVYNFKNDRAIKIDTFFRNYKQLIKISSYQPPMYNFQGWFQFNFSNFSKYLENPKSTPQFANEKCTIYEQIIIDKPEKVIKKWALVGEGGSAKVYQAGLVDFNYINTKDTKIKPKFNESIKLTKLLAFKQPKQQKIEKINHEKKILKIIEKENSANIGQFYFSNQPQFYNILISGYYSFKSLDNLRRISNLTLNSKIYMIDQVLHGVNFLKQSQIFHLDLKQQNILIGKKYYTKITDFGQAYHKDVCKQQYSSGFTLPYAAPQYFKKMPNQAKFNEKIEVYSLGIFIFELIYGVVPVLNRRMSDNDLISYYASGMNKIKYLHNNVQDSINFGPPNLMILIKHILLKCLSHSPQMRPCLDWLIIVFHQIYSLL